MPARCLRDRAWKYVNVRRLFIYLEESIDEGTQWVVFEPNDEALWALVTQSVTDFLTTAWRSGALRAPRPTRRSSWRCDRTTMTQDDIDNGRLICVIGIAPVRPGGVRHLPDPAEDPRGTAHLSRPPTSTPRHTEGDQRCHLSSGTTRTPHTTSKSIVTGVSDDGAAVSGAFTEVTGLELEIPPIEYRGGAEDITVRKIPGLKKFSHITLKRGITGHVGFWNWVWRR